MANLDVVVDDLGEPTEDEQESNPDLLALFAKEDNLVGQFDDVLDDERLAEIGRLCASGFEEDWQSEADWRSDIEELHKLIDDKPDDKVFPWPGAANVVYPMITNAILQFNARSYATLINNGQIALAQVIGSDDGVPEVDEQGRPVLGPEGEPQFKVPPGAKKERADRVSKHMSYQLTEEMEEWEEETDSLLLAVALDGCAFKKIYFDPDLGRNVSEFIPAMDLIVNESTKNLATCPRVSHLTAYYPNEIQEKVAFGLWQDPEIKITEGNHEAEEFVEQHTYLDLDDDGYSEPYIVTYHKDSAKVVRIVANYGVEDIEVNDDEVAKVNKKQYFVKYQCFPSATGKYKAKGFGMLLKPINESVNTLINQLLDAGTLSNTGGGFFAKHFRIKGGSIRFSPAEWHKVDTGGLALKDGIVPLPIREPSAVLFTMLGLLIDAGKEMASIQEVMTGGGAQTAAVGTTLALIEQGMKVYTSIFKRLYRSFKLELKMLYALNSEYLDQDAYQNIQDMVGIDARADYEGESMDIMPAADPNMATDIQKAARAQALNQFADWPEANRIAIMEENLEAMGISEPKKFIIPPSDEPSPQELLALAEMERKKQDSDSKAQDSDTKRLSAAIKAIKELQETEEKGGSGLVNADELTAIIEKLQQEGIIENDEPVPGPEPSGL